MRNESVEPGAMLVREGHAPVPAAEAEVSIVDVLHQRARSEGARHALLFLRDGEGDVVVWSYADLARRASCIAAAIAEIGIAGRRVVLLFEPGLEYVAAFFGVLQAGAVAVPSFTPAGTRGFQRIASIIDDAKPDVVLTAERTRGLEERVRQRCIERDFLWLDTRTLEWSASTTLSSAARVDSLALLQYTSGSTGNPKGVMIDHANLLSNCRALARWMGPVDGWMGCTWLPPYHDMGLMGGVLQPIYAGFPVVMLSPAHFVQNPVRWLRAITRYRVTTTVAPNFALDLCSTVIRDAELDGIDLSSIANVFCGAEPIRADSLRKFHRRFSRYGFRYQAFNPCYGLAEATLFVSGKPANASVTEHYVDRRELDVNHAVGIDAGESGAQALIGCGVVATDHRVRIVDPQHQRPCGHDQVGEIWVAGPSVARGYWERDQETRETFGALLNEDASTRYLRTGDLGFMRDDQLFITGRLKDVVIIAGRNHYPQDIELTAQQAHDALRPHGVAAFGVDDAEGEALIVVVELSRTAPRSATDVDAVRSAIVRDVAAVHGVRPKDVHIGPAGTVPLTTSGKIQRRLCKQMYLQGTLPVARSKGERIEHVGV